MKKILLKLLKKKSSEPSPLKKVPKHIAIIMDGNGRWAKVRGLPRVAGHKRGADSLRDAVRACGEIGVKYLTVYAFSIENWERPKDEVDVLMSLFADYIDTEIDELMEKKVRLRFLGRLDTLSTELNKKIDWAMRKTAGNLGLNLNIMVSYSGRAEITDMVKTMISTGKKPGEISEALIGDYLYTKGMPDPDLLIRTASEMRVSNFLLWQIAYSEIYVTPVLWPDFRRKELFRAIKEYEKRERKFGRL